MSNFHAKRQAEHGAWAFIGAFSVVIRLYSNIDLVIAQPFAFAIWYWMWFLTSIPAYVQISNENVDRIAILAVPCRVRVAGYGYLRGEWKINIIAHRSMCCPRGSFRVPRDHFPYSRYCIQDEERDRAEPGGTLYILLSEHAPIRADLTSVHRHCGDYALLHMDMPTVMAHACPTSCCKRLALDHIPPVSCVRCTVQLPGSTTGYLRPAHSSLYHVPESACRCSR